MVSMSPAFRGHRCRAADDRIKGVSTNVFGTASARDIPPPDRRVNGLAREAPGDQQEARAIVGELPAGSRWATTRPAPVLVEASLSRGQVTVKVCRSPQ